MEAALTLAEHDGGKVEIGVWECTPGRFTADGVRPAAGAGLRVVTGASNTVRGVSAVALGGGQHTAGLDAIDSTSGADDPQGLRHHPGLTGKPGLQTRALARI